MPQRNSSPQKPAYRKFRNRLLHLLNERLSPNLLYHGKHHTLDVLKVCNQFIRRSDLTHHEAMLLRIGALTHDIGFINTYRKHEEEGKRIVRQLAPQYNFSTSDIRIICGMIDATKIPQSPKTKMERIIADADLDYLGRPDFWSISDSLYEELKALHVVKSRKAWNEIQISFMEKHRFFTRYNLKNRRPSKLKRIEEIRNLVSSPKHS